MLFYKSISNSTLELLKNIQKQDIFKNLRLVGGTSLALQIGHRISIDLDLFGDLESEDTLNINKKLSEFGNLKTLHTTSNINIYALNHVKIDIVNYHYPWLKDELLIDELRLASIEDISAMKLSAITGRGSKKDFIDLYFILQKYPLEKLLEFYQRKYADGSIFLVLKSLSYFDDADIEVMPKMFVDIEWETIKSTIINLLNEYLKH